MGAHGPLPEDRRVYPCAREWLTCCRCGCGNPGAGRRKGCAGNNYPEISVRFDGSLQPYSNENLPSEFGVDLRYAFVAIAEGNPDVHPLDRIGVNTPDYEVKTVQVWPGYVRIIAELVNHGRQL